MRVDLNADVGEIDGDVALLEVVTSANVCCGAYGGSDDLMLLTCDVATERGVVIGAQVGYPDPASFGRAPQEPASDELVTELRRQIDLLAAVADEVGGTVEYVKPHGALYNTIVHDERQARAVVEAVAPYGLPLLGLPGSVSLQLATAEGLPIVTEGFVDRAYTPEGTLVPRTEAGAVFTEADAIAAQAVRLAPDVESLCVHGDTPGARESAARVRAALTEAGIGIQAFAR